MKHIMYCVAVFAILVTSCGKSDKQIAATDISLAKVKQPANGLLDQESNASSADTTGTALQPPIVLRSGAPIDPDWDKKIIKTANVSLELTDYKTYNNNLHSRVRMYGAYIAQEQQTSSDNQLMNEVVIKVPVDKFEDVMNSFEGQGIKVIEKNISTQDVTGEVIDTKARLEAKKAVRDRYLQLLKQANNMKDILDVQHEINAIQEDVESATGRVDYLVHSAAYSTINVKYYQFLNGVTAKEIEPTFLSKTADAFRTGGAIITNIILFFVSVWPLAIASIGLVIYLKRGRGKKAGQVQA